MEFLSLSIGKATKEMRWKPIKLGHANLQLSQCLFADDVVLFGRANTSMIRSVKKVLGDLCQRSGKI